MSILNDVSKYHRHIDRFDLSDDQKTELLQTVWRIMESFVDRAFGIDSVQQAGSRLSVQDAERAGSMIELKPIVTTSYRLADTFRIMSGSRRGRKT